MDVLNLVVAILGITANVAIAYAAFRAIRESQRTTKIQGEQFAKQYLQTQDENQARVRPYLRPDWYNLAQVSNSGSTLPKPDFQKTSYTFGLYNVGFGPAFNISIVMYPPATEGQELDPRRYALMHFPALGPGGNCTLALDEGVTSLPGNTVLDPTSGETLYAPAQPGSSNHPVIPSKIPVLARMTLTYQDVEGVKHGAIFDCLRVLGVGWQLVAYLSNLEKTLDELNAEQMARILRNQPSNLLDSPHIRAD